VGWTAVVENPFFFANQTKAFCELQTLQAELRANAYVTYDQAFSFSQLEKREKRKVFD